MTKIEIKNRFIDKVIFSFEKENNTVKDTVEEAVRQNVNLCGANLYGTDLREVDLRWTDLSGAVLSGADLSKANLSGANLSKANLREADLYEANLRDSNLHEADLRWADLSGAVLSGADLRWADLSGANLIRVDLSKANLYGANLIRVDLSRTKNVPYIPMNCPSEGEFTAWKKVNGNKLVQLLIPADARRSSATTMKCRCDKAKVIAITDLDGSNPIESIVNGNYVETEYRVGEMVYPDSFDENRWNECSNGIHFFINKQDAIDY